jgi:hypothetical protein
VRRGVALQQAAPRTPTGDAVPFVDVGFSPSRRNRRGAAIPGPAASRQVAEQPDVPAAPASAARLSACRRSLGSANRRRPRSDAGRAGHASRAGRAGSAKRSVPVDQERRGPGESAAVRFVLAGDHGRGEMPDGQARRRNSLDLTSGCASAARSSSAAGHRKPAAGPTSTGRTWAPAWSGSPWTTEYRVAYPVRLDGWLTRN